MSDLYFMQLNTYGLSIEQTIHWKWGLGVDKVRKKLQKGHLICVDDAIKINLPQCKSITLVGHGDTKVDDVYTRRVSKISIALATYAETKRHEPIFALLDRKFMKEFASRADNGYCYKLVGDVFKQQLVTEL